MPTIEIVRLRAAHQKSLADYFKNINLPEYTKDFFPHPFDEENARRICEYPGRDLYYSVLMDGKEVIGYGMIRGWDEGYEVPSLGICIVRKYQGKGLGRLMLKFLETVSKLQGTDKIMLKVKKDNETAIKLYESHRYVFREYDGNFLIGYKDL